MKRFLFEKAITAYYRNEIKYATDEVFSLISGNKLSSKNLSDLKSCGVTLITKLLDIDKSVVQINFYVMDRSAMSRNTFDVESIARKFGVNSLYEIQALLEAEAFFNNKTNYVACKILVSRQGDSYKLYRSSADKLFSDILHELTHYFDKMSAGDYHKKNYVNALDSDLRGMPILNEFNYLLYAIWSSTERNAFQTSDDSYWNDLKNQINILTESLLRMAEDDDDTVDLAFETLRDMFVKKTGKPCPKDPRVFVKWWCRKTISYFETMSKKRDKDNYLATSSDEQISKLSTDLFEALNELMGKVSVKTVIPFSLYSVKSRQQYNDKLKIELIGFMDELDSATVSTVKTGIKLGMKELPVLGKIYTAVTSRDTDYLRKSCVSLAGEIYRQLAKQL